MNVTDLISESSRSGWRRAPKDVRGHTPTATEILHRLHLLDAEGKPLAEVPCSICGEAIRPDDEFEWDHVIPRAEWVRVFGAGADTGLPATEVHSPGNILPAHRSCNRSKQDSGAIGVHGFRQESHFDTPIDFGSLRAYQRDYVYSLFAPKGDSVSRFAGMFSAHMAAGIALFNDRYVCSPASTAVGKTLAQWSLPYAINASVNAFFPGKNMRRIRRVLVLVKEQGIRSQLADPRTGELVTQPVEFGLIRTAPKVLQLERPRAQIAAGEHLTHDFIVACVQATAWTDPGDPVHELLDSVDLVLTDEVHFAHEKVVNNIIIPRTFTHISTFGFSATLINSRGEELTYEVEDGSQADDSASLPASGLALLPAYYYREAARFDGSMRGLYTNAHNDNPLDDPDHQFGDIIDVVKREEVTDMHGGKVLLPDYDPKRTYHTGDIVNYKDAEYTVQCHRPTNVPPDDPSKDWRVGNAVPDSDKTIMEAVAMRVVEQIEELDALRENPQDARLREVARFHSDLSDDESLKLHASHASTYPAHAIIRVKHQENAAAVVDLLNEYFRRNSSRYPAQKGWRAVNGTGQRPENSVDPAKNPFFVCHSAIETGNHPDKVLPRAARILVVDQKAQEGMNHKLALIQGFTHKSDSVRQRAQEIGRCLRTWRPLPGHVPPAAFDRVYLIHHAAHWENGAVIRRALRILTKLDDPFSGDTLAISAEKHYRERQEVDPAKRREMGLTIHGKRHIAVWVANGRRDGRADVEVVLRKFGEICKQDVEAYLIGGREELPAGSSRYFRTLLAFAQMIAAHDPADTMKLNLLESELEAADIRHENEINAKRVEARKDDRSDEDWAAAKGLPQVEAMSKIAWVSSGRPKDDFDFERDREELIRTARSWEAAFRLGNMQEAESTGQISAYVQNVCEDMESRFFSGSFPEGYALETLHLKPKKIRSEVERRIREIICGGGELVNDEDPVYSSKATLQELGKGRWVSYLKGHLFRWAMRQKGNRLAGNWILGRPTDE